MVNVYKIKVYGALILSPMITVISFFIVLQYYGFLWSLAGMFGGILISLVISKLMINNPFSLMLEGNGILTHNIDSTGIIRPFLVAVQSPYIKNIKQGVNDVFDRNAVYQYATPVKARKPIENLNDGGIRITLDKSQMIKVLGEKEFFILELSKEEFKIQPPVKPKWYAFGFDKPKTVKVELTQTALFNIEERTKENITVIELSESEYNSARFSLFHYPALIWNDQIKSMLTKDFMAGQEKEAVVL